MSCAVGLARSPARAARCRQRRSEPGSSIQFSGYRCPAGTRIWGEAGCCAVPGETGRADLARGNAGNALVSVV